MCDPWRVVFLGRKKILRQGCHPSINFYCFVPHFIGKTSLAHIRVLCPNRKCVNNFFKVTFLSHLTSRVGICRVLSSDQIVDIFSSRLEECANSIYGNFSPKFKVKCTEGPVYKTRHCTKSCRWRVFLGSCISSDELVRRKQTMISYKPPTQYFCKV